MPSQVDKTLSIVFMVEPGALETQAHLLVYSILQNCLDAFQMIAYCRSHLIQSIQPTTIEMLKASNVRLVPITNPFEDGYGAGNKIEVSRIERSTDWTINLDTDTILVRPASILSQAEENTVCVCPTNRNGWTSSNGIWLELYNSFGLELPADDFLMTGGTRGYPFYNAGMVMFSGNTFGEIWKQTALSIDANPKIRKKRPWLDQISMPVAIERTPGQSVKILHRRWNDSPDYAGDETALLHYHRPRRLTVTGHMPQADKIIAKSASDYKTFKDIIKLYASAGVSPNEKALQFEVKPKSE